jgi:hypothetical protein
VSAAGSPELHGPQLLLQRAAASSGFRSDGRAVPAPARLDQRSGHEAGERLQRSAGSNLLKACTHAGNIISLLYAKINVFVQRKMELTKIYIFRVGMPLAAYNESGGTDV